MNILSAPLLRNLLLSLCLLGATGVQSAPAAEPQPVDRIIAVVNNEVITFYELRTATSSKSRCSNGW